MSNYLTADLQIQTLASSSNREIAAIPYVLGFSLAQVRRMQAQHQKPDTPLANVSWPKLPVRKESTCPQSQVSLSIGVSVGWASSSW